MENNVFFLFKNQRKARRQSQITARLANHLYKGARKAIRCRAAPWLCGGVKKPATKSTRPTTRS